MTPAEAIGVRIARLRADREHLAHGAAPRL